MRRKLFVLAAILSVALMPAPTLLANQVDFTSGSGNNLLDASANFIFTSDHLELDVWNNVVNQKSVAQNISDLFFSLSTGQTSATLTTSSGSGRIVASNGTFTGTDPASLSTGWVVTESGGVFHLNGLGAGTLGPTRTILGQPKAASPFDYANANDSIAGNGPHNPFLYGTSEAPVKFFFDITGVTADTTATNVIFSFGSIPATGVPIPPSALLLGSGLLGLVGIGCRRKQG